MVSIRQSYKQAWSLIGCISNVGVDVIMQLMVADRGCKGDADIRNDAFKVFTTMAASDQIQEDDISRLLEILQTSATSPAVRCGTLACLKNMMIVSGRVRTLYYVFVDHASDI